MKKLLNKLGLFTEKDLVKFGNQMSEKKGNENAKKVWHSDIENFKRTLLILLVAIFTSCSAEEVVDPQGETCLKSYYVYKPIGYQGGTWVWDYVFQYSEATTLPATNGFVLINNSNYYTVTCN
jgi:hypothetical protein